MQVQPIHHDFHTIDVSDYWPQLPMSEKIEVHYYYPNTKTYRVSFVSHAYYEKYESERDEYRIATFYHLESSTETI